jgi:fructosamine-3-kinase
MIPDAILSEVGGMLNASSDHKIDITGSKPLAGGDINRAYAIETNRGTWFMKFNSRNRYPGMFEAEARGLRLLHDAGEIRIPGVAGSGSAGDHAFLLLEHIPSSMKQHDFWTNFGTALAKLHQHHGDAFGLDHDNYIGSLPQSNRNHDSWVDFFTGERLSPQLKRARDAGLADRGLTAKMERLFGKLGEIFPEEPPSLIHGDLWNGNYMVDDRGEACLIDPAVYYGHREMDIGMSKLFGGFSEEFYRAYNAEYPMEKGWEERVDICNLYPLLVHVNLFGRGYVGSVESILRSF